MISYILNIIFSFIYFFLIFAILITWIPILDLNKDPGKKIIQIFDKVMEPFRGIIPPIGGVLDISPIFAFIAIHIIRYLLIDRILIPLGL